MAVTNIFMTVEIFIHRNPHNLSIGINIRKRVKYVFIQ